MRISDKTRHFFHVVSNIRPIVWIALYVCITPIFALIYWSLPDGQFRSPDNAPTDYGSWLYYSIVTITTLGFGDYTPAGGWAQCFTAIEVMCGLVFLGFFLNAVGAMKSEIDVESELEKQREVHIRIEKEKLEKFIPSMLHVLNVFIDHCYAVATQKDKRSEEGMSSIKRLMKSGEITSMAIDSLQARIDLTIWPVLLDDCFKFVANYQMFSNAEMNLYKETWRERMPNERLVGKDMEWLMQFVSENGELAQRIETELTEIRRKED